MKKKLIALVAAVVAVVPFTTGGTASAAGGGALAFECNAQLPNFPTSAGHGSCKGTAETTAGPLVGVIGTTPFAVTGPGNFYAEFDYQEPCVANEPPLAGTANGYADITGLDAVYGGATTTASAHITFNWTRGGASAAIVVTSGTLTISGGGTVTLVGGAATAAFAPLLGEDNVCPVGGPLQAVVAGSAVVAGN